MIKRKIFRNFTRRETRSLFSMGLYGYKIKRVWTIVDREYFQFYLEQEKDCEIEDENLIINSKNAFHEDKTHDWSIVNNSLFWFYGMVLEGNVVDLVIEYM